MNRSKPPAADATANRRSQPVRQTRTNPPRTSGLNRTANGRESLNGGPLSDQPIDIFPAITHFTDAITALPKDLVRQFTLLKEVDAKIFVPEENVFQLIHEMITTPPPNTHSSVNASNTTSQAPASANSLATSAGAGVAGPRPQPLATDDWPNDPVMGQRNIPRRQLAQQTARKVKDMLLSLDEKVHVIGVANQILERHLGRLEEIWPHLEQEFSDEAKWGSTTHWAYPENRVGRSNQTDRARRDGTNHITAAAQALAEEAAARTEARKQAVAAKKRQHAVHQESDFDDHDGKHKNDHGKKPHGASKSRKAAETLASVGLGITTPTAAANGNPAPKRRKVEKTANGTASAERAAAAALGASAQKVKTSSPRDSPGPEPASKKRKPLPTASSNGQPKKKNGVAAGLSPSVASSPVLPSFSDVKAPTRLSPPPTSAPRPVVSRVKQPGTQASAEKQRPPSAASNKPNGIQPSAQDVAPVPVPVPKPANEPKTPKEQSAAPTKEDTGKPEAEPKPAANKAVNNRRESSAKMEDNSLKQTPVPAVQAVASVAVTTKSGRASKPSTPALGTFAEAAATKSRPSRSTDGNATKRSHKKGAAATAQPMAVLVADEDANSSMPGEDDDDNIDDDEPRYCYCNNVSYGEMVGCDADDCKREWFHLECVGLKVAPKGTAKWYCKDCKEKMMHGGKKLNGR